MEYKFGTWYPIKEAPKDETPILVIEKKEIMIGIFIDGEWKAEDWNGSCCGCPYEEINPILWMPLPAPPELEKRPNAEG